MAASSSNHRQRRRGGNKAEEMQEIVRHMSNLPGYLERGKPIQDRALNFGVMDWGRLEKWQYHREKQSVVKNHKYSPSSSNSSLLSSTDGSSPHSSKGQSSSPAPLKPDHATLRSHLNISPEEVSSRFVKSSLGNLEKSQDVKDVKDSQVNHSSKKKTSKKSQTRPFQDDLESFHTASSSSSSKGKMKLQDELENFQDPSYGNTRNDVIPRSLKRLLDPLFPSKAAYAETSSEDSKTKAKVKLDFGSCKEVEIDNSCRNNKATESSSTNQALFQMAIKNGRPLFTFAVDNNTDILAATVRNLNGKDSGNSWIYTFFAIHEVQKKKSSWLTHGTKGTTAGQGYLPNVTAQMKVSNRSNGSTREFVLSSVDSGLLGHETLDPELQDELAAIVVRFLRKTDEGGDQDCFSTTVILPGGHHSVPRKGEPSPLIERWRSGGVCDCGGWDIGCRLRTLTNKVQSDRISSSPEAHMTSGHFELFYQGDVINSRPFFSRDVINNRPFFRLSPLKEGIFSVEYNSSLSLLHAFSICISVIECRKSCHHTELRTYIGKRVDDDDDLVTYASLAPLSPVGRV